MLNTRISKIILLIIGVFILYVSLGTQTVNAKGLKKEKAFHKGKAAYVSMGFILINTKYSKHNTAFVNAKRKINKISGARINLMESMGPDGAYNIVMSSVNTKKYDWYGYCSWNSRFASTRLNEYTMSKKKFKQAHYNKVALHELGHAMYMKHQKSNVSSVMKQGKYAYNDYTKLDKDNLKWKY